jgi:hypothetical protein
VDLILVVCVCVCVCMCVYVCMYVCICMCVCVCVCVCVFAQSCFVGSSSSCIERALSAVVHRMAPAAAAAAARQNPDPSISVPDIVISLEKATPPLFFSGEST